MIEQSIAIPSSQKPPALAIHHYELSTSLHKGITVGSILSLVSYWDTFIYPFHVTTVGDRTHIVIGI